MPRFIYYFILDYLLNPKRPVFLILFGSIGLVMAIAPSRVSSFKDTDHIKTLRIIGILMVLVSCILGIAAVQLNSPEKVEFFHRMVMTRFKELKTPYDLKFTKPYRAEVRFPEHSERVLKISVRQVSDQPFATVAGWLLMQAQIYFQKENKELEEKKTRLKKNDQLREQEATKEETLEQANRLLREAGQYWEAKEYGKSLENAKEALRIKTNILGIGHPDVIQIEQQILRTREKLQQENNTPKDQEQKNNR